MEKQQAGTPETNTDEKEEVAQETLNKALELIRSVAKGNGLKPENITLDKFEGEVLNFETFAFFKIDPQISEKHLNGRENADEIVGSEADMRAKTTSIIEKITSDINVRTRTIEALKNRDDLGFGVDNQIISLESLNKTIAVHETCHICSGSAATQCRQCQGQGHITCNECYGSQEINCHECQGRQFITGAGGKQEQCHLCQGSGRIGCHLCHNAGQIQCKTCDATGKMSCTHCSGTGWHTLMAYIKITAKSMFDYDRDALPESAHTTIDRLGPLLVTEKHADVHIIKEEEREQELGLISKDNEYIIAYHVRLPYGDICFKIREKHALEGVLFGFVPELINMPCFLDKLLKRGIYALNEAANSKGNISEKIKKALRYRAIGEIFIASAFYTGKKAEERIKKAYPFGLSDNARNEMAGQANKILKRITQKPRRTGLAIGLAITMALYVLYYLGPVPVRPLLPGAAAQITIDIMIVLLGGAITTFTIQTNITKALKASLGKIMAKNKQRSFAPKIRQNILWGLTSSVTAYFIVLHMTTYSNVITPEWYLNLISWLG